MDLQGGEGLDQVPHDDVMNDDVEVDEGGDPPPMPESADDLGDPLDPLNEQPHPEPEGAGGLAEDSMRTAFDVWHRLIEDASNIGVKNLTFTEVIPSRAVKDVLPALARIHARLRYLGLPLHRLHCDRARELTLAPVRRWTLDRGIITTLTTGSTFKANGRVEAEVGAVKRAVRTLVSAKLCPLEAWPLARHVGERCSRSQLQGVGWPTAPLLKFGVHEGLRVEEVLARSVPSGKHFYTDDVVEPTTLPTPSDPEEPTIFLPARDAPVQLLQSVMVCQQDDCAAKLQCRPSGRCCTSRGRSGVPVLIFQMAWVKVICDVPTTVLKSHNIFKVTLKWIVWMEVKNRAGPCALIQKTHQRVQRAQRQKLQHFNLMPTKWMKESAEGMWRGRLSTGAVAHARSPQCLE